MSRQRGILRRTEASRNSPNVNDDFSYSTLRQADVTSIGADVTCMSGGRIGNVAHMLVDSPTFQEHTNVVIVAGENDITRDDESLEVFREKVEMGWIKFTIIS